MVLIRNDCILPSRICNGSISGSLRLQLREQDHVADAFRARFGLHLEVRVATVGRPMTRLSARQTWVLILLPMLVTFAGQRLYLHLVGVHHVRANGLIIHHLFFGVGLVIPAAFLLAFTPRHRAVATIARVGLGIGSAMVLDEIVYLVATQASDGDYVSARS